MKCVICGNQKVPQNKDGDYLSNFHIPFAAGDGAESKQVGVRVIYPHTRPLCSKCRKDVVVKGLEGGS